jgi:membrane-associated phospholipid phosphatase
VTLAVAGLATYVLLPTAPPWLASYEGDLGGPPVLRLSSEGFDQVGLNMVGSAVKLGQGLVNPVAAMPSLHVAFATLAAGFWWSRVRRPFRPLLALYPLAMCFSLAYAGEHYVLDELAGVAYAIVILAVARTRSVVEPGAAARLRPSWSGAGSRRHRPRSSPRARDRAGSR